jgi:hypothetical protein
MQLATRDFGPDPRIICPYDVESINRTMMRLCDPFEECGLGTEGEDPGQMGSAG